MIEIRTFAFANPLVEGQSVEMRPRSGQAWKQLLSVAFLCAAFQCGADSGTAPLLPRDRNVQIFERREGNRVTLIAHLTNCTEATITVTMNLLNMAATATSPVTVDAKGRSRFELLTIQIIDPTQPFRYLYDYKWRPGRRAGMTTTSFVYALPYLEERRRVLQGPLGTFSHQVGSGCENAIDFRMPIGSKVCAARDGTVVAFWQDSDVGGSNPTNRPYANYLVVAHEDGTFAEYVHLKKNGVLVKLGQKIQMHDELALSGNTGYSSEPHLHFAVFCNRDGTNRTTLPIQFTTKSGEITSLRGGQVY